MVSIRILISNTCSSVFMCLVSKQGYLVVVYYFLLPFAFCFPFPTFLDRCLLGTLVLRVAFAPPPTILNIFPPHTVHIPDMPLRPFFVLIRFSSFISRLTLHFAQYPSVVNLPYFSYLNIRLARLQVGELKKLQ
jgi:hypothetical protein